jgi:hypothetical protein
MRSVCNVEGVQIDPLDSRRSTGDPEASAGRAGGAGSASERGEATMRDVRGAAHRSTGAGPETNFATC